MLSLRTKTGRRAISRPWSRAARGCRESHLPVLAAVGATRENRRERGCSRGHNGVSLRVWLQRQAAGRSLGQGGVRYHAPGQGADQAMAVGLRSNS
jgi:hypothetical protein